MFLLEGTRCGVADVVGIRALPDIGFARAFTGRAAFSERAVQAATPTERGCPQPQHHRLRIAARVFRRSPPAPRFPLRLWRRESGRGGPLSLPPRQHRGQPGGLPDGIRWSFRAKRGTTTGTPRPIPAHPGQGCQTPLPLPQSKAQGSMFKVRCSTFDVRRSTFDVRCSSPVVSSQWSVVRGLRSVPPFSISVFQRLSVWPFKPLTLLTATHKLQA
jgi:hypothetical protein